MFLKDLKAKMIFFSQVIQTHYYFLLFGCLIETVNDTNLHGFYFQAAATEGQEESMMTDYILKVIYI